MIKSQDTIITHLDKLSNDNSRLSWLGTEMNKAVLSSPKQTTYLAGLFDSIANINPNDINTAKSLNFQGIAQYANGDYEAAANSYLESIAVFETTDEKRGLGIALNNLASCYSFRKESLKSIEYYLKALDIATEIKDSVRLALLNNNIGIQYVDMKEYATAATYYDEAITLYGALNQPIYVGITLLSRGNLFIEMESYSKAIEDYKKAMELVPEKMVPLLHAASIGGIGTAYNRLGMHTKAEFNLLKSLKKAEAINHTEQIKESHRELADLYNSTGQFKKALVAYKNYTTAKDSLYNLEQDKNLVDALSKYEAEKNQKEIELLNSQNEVSKLKLEAANRRTLFISLVLGIVGILSFLLFGLYKKIQSQNTIISKALSEKETLLREIHHRVKNNLQFISSLLGLQTEHVSDKVALGALQEGQDRVQSMALIHQNLYQENNLKGVDMAEYFTKLVRGLFDSYNIRKDQISLEMEVEDLNLDVDSVIPIGLVVNELVSNSLKYAFPNKRKGIIAVALKESNDRLIVSVKDDGIGISDNQINNMGTSFGYRLINVFKDQMQAELNIDGSNGTTVTMLITKYAKTKFN